MQCGSDVVLHTVAVDQERRRQHARGFGNAKWGLARQGLNQCINCIHRIECTPTFVQRGISDSLALTLGWRFRLKLFACSPWAYLLLRVQRGLQLRNLCLPSDSLPSTGT